MSYNFERNSPFRPRISREDIGVSQSHYNSTNDQGLNTINTELSYFQKSKNSETPKKNILAEKTDHSPFFFKPKQSSFILTDSKDTGQKKLAQIEILTEELNMNRKKYEKLLSDHAEEKKLWITYIKQLEEELNTPSKVS